MDYKYYERKINDVIMKCPIESGVEILVYNVLDDIVESKGLSLVDINRLWKNRDTRLTTNNYVYTNGLVWQYYENKKTNPKWKISLAESELEFINSAISVSINENKFSELLEKLNYINWK